MEEPDALKNLLCMSNMDIVQIFRHDRAKIFQWSFEMSIENK